jgi:outer membrane lipoprotein LolB
MQRIANPFFLKVFSNGCRRFVGWVVVSITLTGCAWLQGPKATAPESGGFSVKGRLAVRHGDDGFTSNFLWQHAVGRDEIDLWGPMGQGHSRFVDAGGDVSVTAANGEVFRERDAAAAMQRFLGFSLPVDALTHWVRGERAPGYPVDASTSDADGNLVALDQLAWRLEYSDYRASNGGPSLPGRIIATSGDVRVTLLPSDWSFGSAVAFDTP